MQKDHEYGIPERALFSMSTSWKEIYSPVVVNPGKCKDCNDCVHACPVKAIEKCMGTAIVDRAKCAQYVLQEEECLECIMACKSMALNLRVFLIDESGTIKQRTI